MDIKILVIENEPLILLYFKTIILNELKGVEIITACSYKEAVSKAGSLKFDLVLSDIGLDYPTAGIDIAIKIREFSKVPIVFITASPERLTSEIIDSIFPCGVVQKPINHKMLKPVIYMALFGKNKLERLQHER